MEKNEFDQLLGYHLPNWKPKKRPSLQTFHGRTCRIEPLTIQKHARDLFTVLGGPEHKSSWTYLPYGPFHTYQEFESWLLALLGMADTLPYVIVENTHCALGICAFARINPEHGSIEIAHLNYSTKLKRSAAATEAMYLMMHHAFNDLGYRRYEWKCNALNEGSRRAALRLGFVFEGIFRHSNVYKDRNRDTAWFSILDTEWPHIQERFKRWLNPANFHDDGNQKKCLRGV
jgi:RimJ/RimL family protein N-acetyltransferase